MKLQEWCELSGILYTHPTTETKAVSVCCNRDTPYYWMLWLLGDYAVSSVSGPVVWLVPKPQEDRPQSYAIRRLRDGLYLGFRLYPEGGFAWEFVEEPNVAWTTRAEAEKLMREAEWRFDIPPTTAEDEQPAFFCSQHCEIVSVGIPPTKWDDNEDGE